jgi:SulP family sulfate permease
MAFAIAIGVSPQYGLFAAIISGGIQAIFGGSETNISGPAGAFIGVLTAFTAAGHDFSDVLVVGILAGLILVASSLLRIGKFVQYVPYPVILGFTGGIGVIIFKTQVAAASGIDLSHPTELFSRLHEIQMEAFTTAVFTIFLIRICSRYFPKMPSVLMGIAISGFIVYLLGLNLPTVESKYGAIPRSLPTVSIPDLATVDWAVFLPVALSIAALAALETLLSATASDKMTGKRHNPNAELFGCGLANMVGPLFGGIPVCGAIARTTLNARSGSHTWVAALFNALFLLLVVLILAPLVGKTPIASLAGVLIGISISLIDLKLYWKLLKSFHIYDFAMVMATLLVTIFASLTMGILCGLGIALLAFFVKFNASKLEKNTIENTGDSQTLNIKRSLYFGNARDTVIAFANSKASKIDIRFSEGAIVDASGAEALKDIKALNPGATISFSGVSPKLKAAFSEMGVN